MSRPADVCPWVRRHDDGLPSAPQVSLRRPEDSLELHLLGVLQRWGLMVRQDQIGPLLGDTHLARTGVFAPEQTSRMTTWYSDLYLAPSCLRGRFEVSGRPSAYQRGEAHESSTPFQKEPPCPLPSFASSSLHCTPAGQASQTDSKSVEAVRAGCGRPSGEDALWRVRVSPVGEQSGNTQPMQQSHRSVRRQSLRRPHSLGHLRAGM